MCDAFQVDINFMQYQRTHGCTFCRRLHLQATMNVIRNVESHPHSIRVHMNGARMYTQLAGRPVSVRPL